MFTNTGFSYDGIRGEEILGLRIVRSGTGLYDQLHGVRRKVIKDKIRGRQVPYFYGYEEEVLEFEVTFNKPTPWTFEQRAEVTRWFDQDRHKEFISDDFPIIFRCSRVGQPIFSNVGSNEGFVTMQFECDAPHGWSQKKVHTFDLTTNPTSTTIEVYNRSNVYGYYEPIINFDLSGSATSISIANNTDGGRIFEFTGLDTLEQIEVDNDLKRIVSSTGNLRLSNLTSRRFFRMPQGRNVLEVTGTCTLQFICQFPIMI